MTEATDHLGNEVTAEQIVRQLAAMLGWGNTPPWHVLERDLASKLLRLKELGAEAAELRNARLRTTCGKYVGDNDGTCPQLTCIRVRGHEGPCDNVKDDP